MRILTLHTDLPLHPGDLPGFRSAIAEWVGIKHPRFHNHQLSGPGSYTDWEYPLIQFTVRRGRAAILAAGAGAEDVQQHLLPHFPEKLTIAGRARMLTGYRVAVEQVELTWLAEPRPFGLAG
ncbi:MAG: hypothetical protein KDD43_06700, partial [Bdellovibrionales bacterium]|nr:hypothetical protein [Bdellovibrionales bacterium]